MDAIYMGVLGSGKGEIETWGLVGKKTMYW